MPDHHSTRVAYESMLRKWIGPRWGNLPVSAIRTPDIELWLAELECSPKTRAHRRSLMHSLFSFAVRWELASHNPVTLARVRGGCRRRHRPHLLTQTEFHRVLANLIEPYRTMSLLSGLLGLRASEVVALQWDDFDFSLQTLTIERASCSGRVAETKTESSEDLVPVAPALAQALIAYRKTCPRSPGNWVFPSPVTGRPYHQDSICQKHLHPAGVAAGLTRPLGWHAFRHSYRRWLDEIGTPIGIMKELMRHAHISTTMDVYGVGRMTPAKRNAQSALVDVILAS
jgi:integrase